VKVSVTRLKPSPSLSGLLLKVTWLEDPGGTQLMLELALNDTGDTASSNNSHAVLLADLGSRSITKRVSTRSLTDEHTSSPGTIIA
jgi:hypothetical protein